MRRLSPEEQALWDRVVATVRPLGGNAPPAPTTPDEPAPAVAKGTAQPAPPPPTPTKAPARPVPGTTLDGSWDRRLTRGLVQPDAALDLHGHNLSTAYDLLDQKLDMAINSGARLLLLITGKAPAPGDHERRRGAIRAAVHDWLAASRHAAAIASVRGAHPRHGGSGALYIVLRRRR
jgi:DNA-nicking Smr family endonuclease